MNLSVKVTITTPGGGGAGGGGGVGGSGGESGGGELPHNLHSACELPTTRRASFFDSGGTVVMKYSMRSPHVWFPISSVSTFFINAKLQGSGAIGGEGGDEHCSRGLDSAFDDLALDVSLLYAQYASE